MQPEGDAGIYACTVGQGVVNKLNSWVFICDKVSKGKNWRGRVWMVLCVCPACVLRVFCVCSACVLHVPYVCGYIV